MVVLELFLAHLLGDFVFQSNDLIHRKYQSWMGVAEHVCIIAFFTVLFLFPYWHQIYMWEVAGIIFVIHFLQDLLKIKYDIKYNTKKKSTIPFFLDQLFHLGLIVYLASGFTELTNLKLPNWLQNLYFNQILSTFLIGLILVSYTYDITRYQFRRQRDKKNTEYKPDFAGMQKRLFAYSVAFLLAFVLNRSFM